MIMGTPRALRASRTVIISPPLGFIQRLGALIVDELQQPVLICHVHVFRKTPISSAACGAAIIMRAGWG
jgi:hypothetical protein